MHPLYLVMERLEVRHRGKWLLLVSPTSESVSLLNFLFYIEATETACPAVSASANGRMSGGNVVGSTVTFTCNNGYLLIGYSAISCSNTGVWSQDVPTCVRCKNYCKFNINIIFNYCKYIFANKTKLTIFVQHRYKELSKHFQQK